MGGFMGIGNSSAKTDRGNTLGGWNAEWQNLATERNAYGQLFPAGVQQGQTGTANLGQAGDFWKNILGSRQSATAAIAPQTNQIAAQADAMRQAQANLGTSRGGGTSGANQQQQQQLAEQTQNTILNAQPQAAQQLGQVGVEQQNAANAQLHAALTALGMSDADAQNIVETSIKSRPESIAANNQVVGEWEGLASSLLGLGAPGGAASKAAGVIGGIG